MLERSAEQTTEITTELIDRDFLPTATNQERGEPNLEFVFAATILQQEEGRKTFFALSFLQDVALFCNSKRELKAGSPTCRATRRS